MLTVKNNFDFTKSSEDNYSDENAPFVGKYEKIRSQLDYNFHKHYSVRRQYLQDELMTQFLDTIIEDGEYICDKPLNNWIVFTAGAMGAGKGHTLNWLSKQKLFPLESFVNVDPDCIRALLPEFEIYNKKNPYTAGFKTQKEVGYISEVSIIIFLFCSV